MTTQPLLPHFPKSANARRGNDPTAAMRSELTSRSLAIRANIRRQYALLHDRQHHLRIALERFRTRQAELLFDGIEP